MDNISTLLQEIKARTNMSEQQIADRLMVSQPTVNRLLRGTSQCLSSTFFSIQKLHCELVSEVSDSLQEKELVIEPVTDIDWASLSNCQLASDHAGK